MSKQVQLRRGTTAENDAFTGAVGELTVDTTAAELRLHDGSTAGGKTFFVPARKNWIINGDFQVSQRGDYTSATSATAGNYYLDRWKHDVLTVTTDITHSTMVVNGNTVNSLKTTASSNATGYWSDWQVIEDIDSLKGKQLTISITYKASVDVVVSIYDGSASTNLIVDTSKSGQITQASAPMTLSSSATQCRVTISSYNGGAVPLVIGDYIEFTNVKLEIGDTATPFEVEPYAEVLRKCQRYYQILQGFKLLSDSSTTVAYASIPFGVEMRAAPTIDSDASLVITRPGIADYGQSSKSITIANASQYGVYFYVSNYTGLASYAEYIHKCTTSVYAEAEL